MNTALVASFLMIVSALVPARANEPDPSISSHFQHMTALSRERDVVGPIKLEKLNQPYGLLLPRYQNLGGLLLDELRMLFVAADMISSYALIYGDSRADSYVNNMESVFFELRKRDAVGPGESEAMLRSYIAVHRTADASRLQGSSKELTGIEIPDIHVTEGFKGGGASYLAYDKRAGKWELQSASSDGSPARIVVVSGCRISDDAIGDIDGDIGLREAFRRGNAIWLVPARKETNYREIREWNDKFPRQKLVVAYDNSAWEGIDFSSIPAFYFYKDGKLVATYHGWPKEGVPAEVREAVASLGLTER